jgi:hypothetical protein
MAINFPINPSDGDTYDVGGIAYVYNATHGVWNANGSGGSGTTTYATITELPLSGNDAGDQAFVSENNRLYLWNGDGWYNIALINTAPQITQGGAGSYVLANDGTPTVITLIATDPEEIPITWSYSVTSGSLGDTTVSQADNVFTITPSTNDVDGGIFSITFTASDGVNLSTDVNSFSLNFGLTWNETNIFYPDGGAGNKMWATAIDGNTAVVGTWLDNEVYVYYNDGTSWSQQQKLTSADTGMSPQYFGYSVDIEGDTIVVGAMGTTSYTGSAHVFTRSGSAWSHSVNLVGANVTNSGFGWSVGISGNDIIVGEQDYDLGSDANVGKIYIYRRANSSSAFATTPVYTHISPAPQAISYYGKQVAMDGDTAIAYENRMSGPEPRALHVHRNTNGTWALEQTILITSGNPYSSNQENFDIYGDTIAVGLSNDSVEIYERSGTSWSLQATITPAASDIDFGSSVALGQDFLVVGAKATDADSGSNRGSIYVYTRSGTVWSEKTTQQLASDNATTLYFGDDVSVSSDGSTIIASGNNQGAAYILEQVV